ncbi:MAG: glycosyltransferase family 4 protein [Bacteriovoracaceae bacterium]
MAENLYKLDRDLHFYAYENDRNVFSGEILKKKKWHRKLPFLFQKPKVWHATHQDVDVYPSSKGIKRILTVHDLNALTEIESPERKNKYLRKLQKKVDAADIITCISDFTKTEIEKNLNVKEKRVEVIYNGVCLNQNESPLKPKALKFSSKDFLFSLGTVVPKKNYRIILEVAKKDSSLNFVIAGTLFHDHAKELLKEVEKLGLQNQVQFLGEITEAEKNYLLQEAKAFFHPSLLEGFGLPIIESMANGIPVVSSNACSLPEIGGGLSFLFNPHNSDEAYKAIQLMLESEIDRTKLIQHGTSFSWKKAAEAYYDLYLSLL